MKTGLSLLSSVTNVKKCADFINEDNSNSIRLLFPNLDFGYNYDSTRKHDLYDYFDSGAERLIMDQRGVTLGDLMPHVRIAEASANDAKSLR